MILRHQTIHAKASRLGNQFQSQIRKAIGLAINQVSAATARWKVVVDRRANQQVVKTIVIYVSRRTDGFAGLVLRNNAI